MQTLTEPPRRPSASTPHVPREPRAGELQTALIQVALVLSDTRPTKSSKQDKLRSKPTYAIKRIVLSTQHCMQNTHLDALLLVLYWLDEVGFSLHDDDHLP